MNFTPLLILLSVRTKKVFACWNWR